MVIFCGCWGMAIIGRFFKLALIVATEAQQVID